MVDNRTGKERCEYLRKIRIQVAEENGIDYTPSNCTHEGDCIGTCPQCDKELRELTSLINDKYPKSEDRHSLMFDKELGVFSIIDIK